MAAEGVQALRILSAAAGLASLSVDLLKQSDPDAYEAVGPWADIALRALDKVQKKAPECANTQGPEAENVSEPSATDHTTGAGTGAKARPGRGWAYGASGTRVHPSPGDGR